MLSHQEGGAEGGVVPSKPILVPDVFDEISAIGMKVEILGQDGKLPVRGSKDAAGYGLHSAEDGIIPAGSRALIGTNIAIGIPGGHYA